MTIAFDPDAPTCPTCGYLLVGIDARQCPECGTSLQQDWSIYRPSRRSTPWSAIAPNWLPSGIPLVMLRPVTTLSWCGSHTRVTLRRAIAFAAIVTLSTAVLWPVIREFGLALVDPFSNGRFDAFIGLRVDLAQPMHWRRLGVWEAWAISRWWLLFGSIALAWPAGNRTPGPDRGARAERFVRLLLFAPWISLLELLFLAGVWVVSRVVVPEPSTLFATFWPDSLREMWTDHFWLVRGVVPSAAIGLVYFRAVLGHRWHTALPLSLTFVPVALLTSVVWTLLFEPLGILWLAYGN